MIVVGHRGARNEAPENTLAGFLHAYQNGCRHFELDIQLSRDHQLAVFHDSSLKRTTGERGLLVERSMQSLRQLDARRNTPGWGSPCPIPSLDEVVSALPGVKHWQFEVKPDSRFRLAVISRLLQRFIHQHQLETRATITSSSQWLLRHIKTQSPDCSIGYVAESFFIDPIDKAQSIGCDYLCMSQRITSPARVLEAKKMGFTVSIWTVNDLPHMERLKKMGVDSVITDIPSHAIRCFTNLS